MNSNSTLLHDCCRVHVLSKRAAFVSKNLNGLIASTAISQHAITQNGDIGGSDDQVELIALVAFAPFLDRYDASLPALLRPVRTACSVETEYETRSQQSHCL
jgi:hypothetical protein